MIADMFSNKKISLIVNELFIRGKKLNIFVVFVTQSYFALPKNVRLNFMHYFIMKILSKWELQQIAFNIHLIFTAWKVSVFGVIVLVRIFPHLEQSNSK